MCTDCVIFCYFLASPQQAKSGPVKRIEGQITHYAIIPKLIKLRFKEWVRLRCKKTMSPNACKLTDLTDRNPLCLILFRKKIVIFCLYKHHPKRFIDGKQFFCCCFSLYAGLKIRLHQIQSHSPVCKTHATEWSKKCYRFSLASYC